MPRWTLTVNLSVDHRAVDGVHAAAFMQEFETCSKIRSPWCLKRLKRRLIEPRTGCSNQVVLEIYRRMVRIRRFEDRLYQMFLQGLDPAPYINTRVRGDCRKRLYGSAPGGCGLYTHRPVGHAIAKGVPLKVLPPNCGGKPQGVPGKGGQMHLVDSTVGFPPSSAVVGSIFRWRLVQRWDSNYAVWTA